MNGVMHFGQKSKLSLKYVAPYDIFERISLTYKRREIKYIPNDL